MDIIKHSSHLSTQYEQKITTSSKLIKSKTNKNQYEQVENIPLANLNSINTLITDKAQNQQKAITLNKQPSQ